MSHTNGHRPSQAPTSLLFSEDTHRFLTKYLIYSFSMKRWWGEPDLLPQKKLPSKVTVLDTCQTSQWPSLSDLSQLSLIYYREKVMFYLLFINNLRRFRVQPLIVWTTTQDIVPHTRPSPSFFRRPLLDPTLLSVYRDRDGILFWGAVRSNRLAILCESFVFLLENLLLISDISYNQRICLEASGNHMRCVHNVSCVLFPLQYRR